MSKIVVVLTLHTDDMDEAEDFMQALFDAGDDAGVVQEDYNWYLMEGPESLGETLH